MLGICSRLAILFLRIFFEICFPYRDIVGVKRVQSCPPSTDQQPQVDRILVESTIGVGLTRPPAGTMMRTSLLGCIRPRGSHHAAYTAALALVVIQVGIGIILKASQSGNGKYDFSPSASVTISEFFKMILSAIFFYNECCRRTAEGTGPSTRGRGGSPRYSTVPTTELPMVESKNKRRAGIGEEDSNLATGNVQGEASSSAQGNRAEWLSAWTYWSYVRGEVPRDLRYGFCKLALYYVLINNLVCCALGSRAF
jgi:hypothetical protein